MKKLIALLLAAVMLLGLVACGANQNAAPSTAEDTPAPTKANGEAEETVTAKLNADGLGGYKVGLFYLPNVEGLGKETFDYFDHLCQLTNCEPLHYEMISFSSDDIMAACETLVSQGADAIICPIGSSPAMFEYLDSQGVYYCLLTRSYTEEVCDVVMDSEYFCGFIGDLGGEGGVEFNKGYAVMEVLAKEGCKKVAIDAGSEGETMNDERVKGMQAAASDYGMEVLSVYRGSDHATGVSDILASYSSELDGIVGIIDSTLAALQTAGLLGQIKVSNIDPSANTRDYLEAGYISAVTNEGNGYLAIMYIQLFNALTGADRLFTGDHIVPQMPGCVIDSVEVYDAIQAAMAKVPGGLTGDEILSLNSIANPGLSVEEREDILRNMCTAEYWNIPAICERVNAYGG